MIKINISYSILVALHTKKAIDVGIINPSAVHLVLFVSFFIVSRVVVHGQ